MDIILYFAFGLLNICLFVLVTNIYRKKTGIDLFPGRLSNDKLEMTICILSYFICGPFGTIIIGVLGVGLLAMWLKYYRKK